MNNKGQIIGKIIADFPALILVFTLMLIFVLYSGAISKAHADAYSLLEDFSGDYIKFNGKIVTVNEAIKMTCKNDSLRPELKTSLRTHFANTYPKDAFALTQEGSLRIPQLYSWYGAFEDQTDEWPIIARNPFNNVFDSKSEKEFICTSPIDIILYVKSRRQI